MTVTETANPAVVFAGPATSSCDVAVGATAIVLLVPLMAVALSVAVIVRLPLPGKLRKIKSVDFAYSNLPGGGRAQLEVWARAKPQP